MALLVGLACLCGLIAAQVYLWLPRHAWPWHRRASLSKSAIRQSLSELLGGQDMAPHKEKVKQFVVEAVQTVRWEEENPWERKKRKKERKKEAAAAAAPPTALTCSDCGRCEASVRGRFGVGGCPPARTVDIERGALPPRARGCRRESARARYIARAIAASYSCRLQLYPK